MTMNRAVSSRRPQAWIGLSLALQLAVLVHSRAAVIHVDQRHPAASDESPGSAEQPLKTIGSAAARVKPGDTVSIHAGVYRESVVVEASGTADAPIRFEAAPAAFVSITGADVLTEWRKEEGEENVFSTEWPHRYISWSKTGAHPANGYHKMIGRCEQVVINQYPLLHVLERSKLTRGTFYVDLDEKRLYVQDRANRDVTSSRCVVEASIRSVLWQAKGAHIHLRGVRFRYAANMAQHGCAIFAGDGCGVQDCVFERTNSIGATFRGEDIIVRRCTFQDNGQMGFSAGGAHRLLMSECLCRNNNTKGFNRGWEAGGNKIVLCRGLVIEKSRFLANRGIGIWFDIGNEDCVVRNCLIADNEHAGIFYEISYGLHAHDNVIIGNGFDARFGAWGADGAITLSSSPDCVIERNLMVGNKEGFQFREQNRSTPLIGDKTQHKVWNHHNVIRHNVIAYNRDVQTAGWFDVKDGRHWPRARQRAGKSKDGKAAADIAAEYKDTQPDAQAPRALEELHLTLNENLYAARAGQRVFQWGCKWREHELYDKLTPVTKQLGLERDSRLGDVVFADWISLDLRVPKGAAAIRMRCYPQGDIPGVKLGVKER